MLRPLLIVLTLVIASPSFAEPSRGAKASQPVDTPGTTLLVTDAPVLEGRPPGLQ